MSNLLYLGIAVGVSLLGALVVWLRNRKPTSLEAGIEEFQRELRALSPERKPIRRAGDEPRRDGRRTP